MTLRYLEQDSDQTLRQGLDEYFATIPGLITAENAPKDVADLFRFHDVGHVVFGCRTTFEGEALADTFCMFGTDVALKDYMRYAQLPEAQAIFKKTRAWPLMTGTVRSTPRIARALWQCSRMPRKWPFWDHGAFLDTPLHALREQFRIRVIPH